jgi:multisubunit Na+/H+ antiporter MnhB subunit
MDRPSPVQWIRYAFGATLPARFAEWTLHDTTCGTWVLRHLARVLTVIAVPLVLVVLLVPASPGLRALTAFVTGACTVLLTAILSNEMTERRVQKAGFAWGTGEKVRAQRAAAAQSLTAQRYRDRRAARGRDA